MELSPEWNAWLAHDKKVRPYILQHRILGWSQKILNLLVLYFLWRMELLRALQSYVFELTNNIWLEWLVYFGILALFFGIIGFPFSLLSFWVEKKFHLSRQSLGSWFKDQLKAIGVGGVLMAIVLSGLLGCIYVMKGNWWWSAASLLILFSVLLAQLAPVLLIPIFFPLKPMENSPLKERLLALCARYKVHVKDVYHLGMGEKTEKGNAAFVGLGKTKRILIGDTLYEKFPVEEVEAVFAHELGHQVHNDLVKGLLLSTVFIYIQFVVASRFFTPADLLYPLHAFYLFIFLGVIQIPFGVVQVLFSRDRERKADGFAKQILGTGKELASALERLTFQNWGYFKPNKVLEFLTYSHPAPWRRITSLRPI